MRKIGLILVLLLAVALSRAYAHPPSDIALKFDPATKMLTAVISHDVNNSQNHFIKEVEVFLNGRRIIVHNISRQDNLNTQTVSYIIPDAKKGDVLLVEAECNISGKSEKRCNVD